MALFTDEAAVYGAFGKLFWDVIADERSVGVLVRTNTILQLQLRDPRSTVTVAVRQAQQPLVYFGPTTRRPEVFLQMDADTAHGWLLGEINPTVAFGDNRIKARGPSGQILAILAWAKVLTPCYKAIIQEHGGELPPPLAPPAQEEKPAPAPAEEPAAAEAAVVEADPGPAQDAPAPEAAAASAADAPTAEPEAAAADPAPAAEAPVADPAPAEQVPVPAVEGPAPTDDADLTAESSAPAPVPVPAPAGAPAPDPAPEDEAPADA